MASSSIGIGLALRSSTVFTRLTTAVLSFTLFLYVSINMAMVLGLAPVVGVPLPLPSYGGSAMMTVMILLGILMAVDRFEKAGRGDAGSCRLNPGTASGGSS